MIIGILGISGGDAHVSGAFVLTLIGPVNFVRFNPFWEVVFVKDMLYALLALVTAAAAVFSWVKYTGSSDNKVFLVLFVILVLATVALGAMFLSGRVNKSEEIHITE